MNGHIKCRICNSDISPFMTFGNMPIANGFLYKEDFDKEYFFEMKPAFCEKCQMFQLVDQPEPNLMFNNKYPFFSSLSEYMKMHFNNFANSILDTYLIKKQDPFVIELGSNDGIMLQHFKNRSIRHLGIEPSSNVAEVAIKKGINTTSKFFNFELANEIIEEYGKADVIMAANVICHIPDLNNVFKGFEKLLTNDGLIIFEDPYLGDMLSKTSYDQIYDEHVYIFSASSVKYISEKFNLELVNVENQITHGGSMRYYIAKKGSHKVSKSVTELIEYEKLNQFDKLLTYIQFKNKCEKSKNDLKNLLLKLKKENKNIVGYGATSKSTTILNYCNINSELIDYISDTTPEKQNKFSPGSHIPIYPYEKFRENFPDYAVLFAWNHAKEIFDKEKEFRNSGRKWIKHVPQVEVF